MATHEVGVMAPDRRRLLIETAAREFARTGYERASLNRVIRACGMSKSSFYHYVASKAALFDMVVTEAGGSLIRALEVPDPEKLTGPDFWVRIAQLLEQLLVASQHEEMFDDFGRLFYLPDAPTGGSLDEARAHIDAWLGQALAAGRASGAVREDLPASLQGHITVAVLWAMDEWSLRHMVDLDPRQRQQLALVQLDAIRRLLAP
jgi:AcrR family transcriptional regulator